MEKWRIRSPVVQVYFRFDSKDMPIDKFQKHILFQNGSEFLVNGDLEAKKSQVKVVVSIFYKAQA